MAGLGTALLLRAAPAAMLEGLRGASSTPGPGGSTRWGNSPHEHGVRATPKEKTLLQEGPCPTDLASRCQQHWDGRWGIALHLAGRLSPSSRALPAQVWTRTRARMRCSVPRGDSSFIPVRR